MKNLFEHTSAPWIRYSSYEYKTGSDNNLYITVSRDAKPEMYHPMQEAGQLVIDAVNVGLAAMHKVPEEELKEVVLDFIKKYGFLGFMTALPTTADFIIYESVYLPKNHFIKEESLPTEDYLAFFYPFDKPDFRKRGACCCSWRATSSSTPTPLAPSFTPRMGVRCSFSSVSASA